MDDKITSLTRAIQGQGDPTPVAASADPLGFRARIIRIANDLFNMQRPDRRARLEAGDELMALAEEMRASLLEQYIETATLKARVESLAPRGGDTIRVGDANDSTPDPVKLTSAVFAPTSAGPESEEPSSRPATHEEASV